jgi:hypothetical protein
MVVQDPAALMQMVLQSVQAVQADSTTPLRVVLCSGWSGAPAGGQTLDAKSSAALQAGCQAAGTLDGSKQQLLGLQQQQQQQQQQQGVESELLAVSGSGGGRCAALKPAAAGVGGSPSAVMPQVFFTSEVSHEWLFPR